MMILLDTTVLSNFALVGKTDLLIASMGPSLSITTNVLDEFLTGVSIGKLPRNQLTPSLNLIEMRADELPLFEMFQASLDIGEASILAVATNRQARILTDDREARKVAAQRQIAVGGTLGVLKQAVQMALITLPEANNLLHEMIAKGYRSPVSDLADL